MDCGKVDTKIDFLQYLETDTSVYIMSLLDDPTDIFRASCVSHFWRHFVISNGLAKKLCSRTFPQLSNSAVITVTSEKPICRVDNALNTDVEGKILVKEHKAYAALFLALTRSKVSLKDCITHAVSASSTDNYPSESIVNTLNLWRPSYWSSEGQSNPNVPETIIYRLRPDTWLITEVDIQPFEAFFQTGNPIYSAKSVRIRLGRLKPQEDIGRELEGLPLDAPADKAFIWNYTSPEFPMKQENCLQRFQLPEPVICVDSYLQIELLGRVQRQETDGLFYICVCCTRALGRPLHPAFEMEVRETDGQKLLKYYPEHLTSVLQPGPNDETPETHQLEEEMLWEQRGLLENMIRGIGRRRGNPVVEDAEEEVEDEDDDDEE